MPHDCVGRIIEVGDVIKVAPLNQKPQRKYVGVISDMHSSEQMCTGQIQFQKIGVIEKDYFNAQDSELILKADGSEPVDSVAPDKI